MPPASPSGRLEATVTFGLPLFWSLLLSSSVSVEIATRFSGSKRRSRIDSLSVTVSTLTSTTAFPVPTRASIRRCTRSRSASARSSALRPLPGSSSLPMRPARLSITATSSGTSPGTAEATRYFSARACAGVIAGPATVTEIEAEGVTSRWKGFALEFAMCTRAAAMSGLATMVRASSPSLARQ